MACFITGLMIEKDFNNIDITYEDDIGGSSYSYSLDYNTMRLQYIYCVSTHAIMVFLAVLSNLMTTKGRFVNISAKTPEKSNLWLIGGLYIEAASVFLYLYYSVQVTSKFLLFQVCPLLTSIQPACF